MTPPQNYYLVYLFESRILRAQEAEGLRMPLTAFIRSRLWRRKPAAPGPWRGTRAGVLGLLALFFIISAGRPAGADTGAHLQDYLGQVKPEEIFPGADNFAPPEGNPPAAAAYKGHQPLGYVYLNSDVVDSTGYSGKPIRILVGIDLDGRIVGAKLVDHHEPIVLIGIPAAKLIGFIRTYVGLKFDQTPGPVVNGPPADIISGATVTTMVIGDSLTRSAIRIAQARALGGATAAKPAPATATPVVDPTKGTIENWAALLGDGSVRRLALSVGEINAAFAHSPASHAADAPEPGPDSDSFITLYAAVVSVPAIGRSLLGEDGYKRLSEELVPGQQAILIAGEGRYSFKGSGYVRGGIFDRFELIQGDRLIRFHDRDYERLGVIHAASAPDLPEIGLFLVKPDSGFDPAAAWRLTLLVQRATGAREKAFLTFDLSYSLPAKYTRLARPEPEPAQAVPAAQQTPAPTIQPAGPRAVPPLWMKIWRAKLSQVVILGIALLALTAIFFFQDGLVRRPRLYRRLRIGFLTFTLLWMGWYAHAQVSVVNIHAFVNALRTDFRWETFLMDPLIFILWFAIASAMLFWARGAFCGWLCPFGALQELLSAVAKRLRIPQLRLPFGLHQRLWPIKYVIFLILFGLSLYDLSLSEEYSEIEPFKTAIILDFVRSWPFVLYAGTLLAGSVFVERFFCRYLCPLGAALAIPARLRMFDWLKRYRECGNPCQRCANECPVQAIHPEGTINPNECIQCLNCQVLYYDDHACPVMIQRRLKAERRAAVTGAPPAPPKSGPPLIQINTSASLSD